MLKKKIIFLLFIIFIFNCKSQVKQETILLSSTKNLIPGVPLKVLTNTEEKNLKLSNLKLENKDNNISLNCDLNTANIDPLSLIIFIEGEDKLFIINVDKDKNLLFTNMNDTNKVQVLFTLQGYDLKKDTLNFTFKKLQQGWPSDIYDLNRLKIQIHIFCVMGNVTPHYLLPDGQDDNNLYHACSNVLSQELDL